MANWRQAADAVHDIAALPAQQAMVALNSSNNVRCYVGWPDPNQLRADLTKSVKLGNQVAHVSIYALPGSRLTSRYTKGNPSIIKHDATEGVTVVGGVITIAGPFTAGDNVFAYVNGAPAQTTVVTNDTAAAVATRLAAAITALGLAGITANAPGGGVVNVGGAFSVAAAAHGQGTVMREVSRLTRRFQVTVWAADDVGREAVSSAVIPALANAEFLTFADGSKGRILLEGEALSDFGMVAGLMREDTLWQIEYPWFLPQSLARVGAIVDTIAPLTPMQQVLGVGGQQIVLVLGAQTVTVAGGSRLLWNEDLSNGLAQGANASIFITSMQPVPNSDAVFLNGERLKKVASSPQLGEYTIASRTITLWRATDSTDYVVVSYEI